MDVYVYQRSLYCKACGERLRKAIQAEGTAPQNIERDDRYDDMVYPKGPYADGGGPSDVPQHCGAHDACVNPITLESGHLVGRFLENPLTQAGEIYVFDCLAVPAGSIEILKLWKEFYSDELGWKLPDFVPLLQRHNVLRAVAAKDRDLREQVSQSVLGHVAGVPLKLPRPELTPRPLARKPKREEGG